MEYALILRNCPLPCNSQPHTRQYRSPPHQHQHQGQRESRKQANIFRPSLNELLANQIWHRAPTQDSVWVCWSPTNIDQRQKGPAHKLAEGGRRTPGALRPLYLRKRVGVALGGNCKAHKDRESFPWIQNTHRFIGLPFGQLHFSMKRFGQHCV